MTISRGEFWFVIGIVFVGGLALGLSVSDGELTLLLTLLGVLP